MAGEEFAGIGNTAIPIAWLLSVRRRLVRAFITEMLDHDIDRSSLRNRVVRKGRYAEESEGTMER